MKVKLLLLVAIFSSVTWRFAEVKKRMQRRLLHGLMWGVSNNILGFVLEMLVMPPMVSFTSYAVGLRARLCVIANCISASALCVTLSFGF